jgi:uncharacterized protein with GYD domain
MQIFVTQGRYSREAIKGMIDSPEDRGPVVAKLCEQAGGRLLAYYLTFGEHDFLTMAEMPSHREAASVVLAAAAGGASDLKTTPAMSTAEAKEVFAATGKLMPGYQPPGAGCDLSPPALPAAPAEGRPRTRRSGRPGSAGSGPRPPARPARRPRAAKSASARVGSRRSPRA